MPQPLQSASLMVAFCCRLVEGDGGVGAERDAGFAAGALLLEDVGRVRLLLDVALVDQHHALRPRRRRPGRPCRECRSAPGRRPARKTPSVKVFTGASLGCRSRKKPSVPQLMLNRRRTSWASACGSRPVASTTMSTGMRRTKPASVSSTRMTSLPSSSGRHGPVGDFAHAAADEVHAFFEQLVVELLVAFARRAHVDVEVVDLGAGVLLEQVRQLQANTCSRRASTSGWSSCRASRRSG